MPAGFRATFRVLNTHLRGQEFPLVGGMGTVGRGPECAVQIDQTSVSRNHARVEEAGGRFMVRDLGSRNGIKINGLELPEAELRSGDVLTVGEVELRFDLVPAQGAAAPESPPPAVAAPPIEAGTRPLTGMDIMAAAREGGPVGPVVEGRAGAEESETGPVAGLNFRLIFAVVFGLTLAVGGAILGLRVLRGGGPRGPVRGQVLLRVGDRRWWGYSKQQYGEFTAHNLSLAEEEVADVRKCGPAEMIVTGKAGGEVTAAIVTNRGRRLELRIIVRGRAPDPLAELIEADLSEDERRNKGEQFVSNGLLIQEQSPYLAMKEYEKAMAVLNPLRQKGAAYLRAKQLKETTSAAIDARWDKLSSEAGLALSRAEYSRGVDLFDTALALIPDPSDPRHQKAAKGRWRAIDAMREADKRARKGR